MPPDFLVGNIDIPRVSDDLPRSSYFDYMDCPYHKRMDINMRGMRDLPAARPRDFGAIINMYSTYVMTRDAIHCRSHGSFQGKELAKTYLRIWRG